jgi:hypothetical protein
MVRASAPGQAPASQEHAMLNHPHIASQLAAQHQREMLAHASQQRLRRQLRAQPAQPPAAGTTAQPCRSWQVRAQTVLRALVHRPAFRRPAI